MRIRLLILVLAAGALVLAPSVPGPLRFAGVSTLIWALPGWGYRRLALSGEPASLLDHVAFAALAPWAMHGIFGPVVAPLGVSPVELTLAVAGLGVVLAFVPGIDRRAPETGLVSGRGLGFDRLVIGVGIALAVLLWAAPPYLELKSDLYAHVAAVRACIEEGRIFPLHEFYPPGQGTGADPRFGVGHSYYAAWASLSGWTPLAAWHGTASLAVLGFCLGLGSLVRVTCESPLGRGLALLVFLAAYGGSAYNPMRVAPYPLWLGLSVVWLALARVLRDATDATWRTTLGAALLLVGSAGLHVLAFLLGLGMLLIGRWSSRRRRRGWWTRAVLLSVLLGLPILGARFWISYGNVNPIHQKPWQNIQWLPGWYSASPSFLVDWLWPLGFFGVLLVPPLLRQAKDRESVRWSTTLSVISLVWLMIPLLLTPSMKLLGFLPMRLVLTIVFPILIGQWLDGRGLGPLRASSFLGGVAVAALSLVMLSHRIGELWSTEREPLVKTPAWTELVGVVEDRVDRSAVILSDPYTMLALKAMASPSIVAVPDGRSSPRDAQSVERLRASWRALSASVDGEVTDEILARYGVTHVLLDHLFDQTTVSYEYPIVPETFEGQTAKFVGNPDRFEVLWQTDGLCLLQVKQPGSWNESYLAPCVEPRTPAAREIPLAEGFSLLDPQLQPAGARAWKLAGRLGWQGEGVPPFRQIVIRADRDPSPTPSWATQFEKPYRKFQEKAQKVVYRQRWTKHTECPTYLLGPDVQLPLAFDLTFPEGLDAGDYRVSLQVSDFSVFTVLELRDFLRDADAYSGPPLGTVALPAGSVNR